MKKRFPSFLAGAAAALALTALATSALAASGQVQFNFARAEVARAVRARAAAAPARNDGNRFFMEILPFCVCYFPGDRPPAVLSTERAGGLFCPTGC